MPPVKQFSFSPESAASTRITWSNHHGAEGSSRVLQIRRGTTQRYRQHSKWLVTWPDLHMLSTWSVAKGVHTHHILQVLKYSVTRFHFINKYLFFFSDGCLWFERVEWFCVLFTGQGTVSVKSLFYSFAVSLLSFKPFELKGPWSVTPLFLFTCESLAVMFYSEHVETKEITMKLFA